MARRVWHYIKRNHGTRSPSNVLYVDTEAQIIKKPSKNRAGEMQLEQWAATHVRYHAAKPGYRKEYAGDSSGIFWELVASLTQEKKPLWIIGHCMGFDLTLLEYWELIEHGEITLGNCCLESPPLWIECEFDGKPLRLVDSYNYFHESLDDIGKWIGLKKLRDDYASCPEDERSAYCRRDVDIVEKAMSKLMLLHREHDWGVWKYTLSGMSWQCFRHRFLDTKILVHCDDEALAMERRAYYGGPATVYQQESFFEPIYHVDVNSLYPYVMYENQFPVRLYKQEKDIGDGRLRDILGNFGTVAHVALETDTYPYPIYHQNRVRYANGRFLTYLAGPELAFAERMGHIRKIVGICLYELQRPFKRFVNELHSDRLAAKINGDDITAKMLKILMNSLYGKFAQRSIKWKDDKRIIPPCAWGHFFEGDVDKEVPKTCRALGWHTQVKQKLEEGAESCPIISAYVTSYGRLFMWNAVAIAGPANVLYSDCDSLHVNEVGYRKLEKSGLVDQNMLGRFKLVATYSAVRYYGPKRYEADDMVVMSGRKRNARTTSARKWVQDEIEEVQSVIERGPTGTILYKTVEKSLCEPSFDGRLSEDGLILPPLIEEW